MKYSSLTPQFLEVFPKSPDEGILYISIEHATAVHLCVCGCRNSVYTPFSPHDWRMTYDGDTVTLHPSIGNWSFPCKSHYWIRKNKVQKAPAWSQKEIEYNRRQEDNWTGTIEKKKDNKGWLKKLFRTV